MARPKEDPTAVRTNSSEEGFEVKPVPGLIVNGLSSLGGVLDGGEIFLGALRPSMCIWGWSPSAGSLAPRSLFS